MLLQVKNLTYKYHLSSTPAIFNFNYKIDSGEINVIAGSCGSGKSTLTYLLAGIYPGRFGEVSDGTILYEGQQLINKMPFERLYYVSLMFQNAADSFCMKTLREELRFVLDNLQLSDQEIMMRINEVVQGMHLTSFVDRPFTQISEGQKQLAALACVLVIKSKLVILDEPFAHLDDETADFVLIYLHKMRRKYQMSFIIIDHLVERWLDVADSVAIMGKDGTLIADEISKGNFSAYEKQFKREGIVVPYVHKPRVYHEYSDEIVMEFKKFELAHKNGQDLLLTDINFQVPLGGIIGIYGKSGVGKTTLLEALANASNYQGDVYLNERELKNHSFIERANKMVYVVQNTSDVFLNETVFDEFCEALYLANPTLRSEEIKLMADDALRKIHLERYYLNAPYTLSIGQQRLLLLQMAMYSSAQVLLIDEPTYGQDYQTLTYVMEQLRVLQKQGKTIIFTTHNMDVAREYSDIMLHYHKGKLEVVR